VSWWAGAVGYEVYIRSFADSDGDGVGDLGGLLGRLDYLAWLGVDVVWVTPFYPSPMRDHGYDVADFRAVEPTFGDHEVLDEVIARTHELGMRLLIDLVPNHTSSDHPWFAAARSSVDDQHRDYYVWRDPAPDGGPPNNWMSVFGGPAWTLDEASGQHWLHLFLAEQPDLNWENPAVADEFDDILRFWLDRGVDGFRVDVAHALRKAPGLPDNPPATTPDDAEMGTVAADWETLTHLHDQNQPEVLDIYRRWRQVVEPAGGVLLGEVYLLESEHVAPYIAADDGLHLAFWFQPMHVPWTSVGTSLREGTSLRPSGVAWVQGSHDRARAATRYGGGDLGRRRQLAVATLQAGMPGGDLRLPG
jgi:alpha-glucosidase